MKKKKADLPKWKYDFSCKKCRHIQYIKDKAKHRDGDYCIKAIERIDAGLPSPIHAGDDRVVRSNNYQAGMRVRMPEKGRCELYAGGSFKNRFIEGEENETADT